MIYSSLKRYRLNVARIHQFSLSLEAQALFRRLELI